MSDGDSPSGELSEFETQFVPRSSDDEILWEVIEIVAERGKKYQVRWAGSDPKTGKPWPLDWVPKRDCTDHLVKAWKRKKAEKRRRSKKADDRPTTKSRSSTLSIVSMTTTSRKTRSTSVQNVSTDDEEPPHVQPLTVKPHSSKRKRLPDISESPETPEPEYPKKKRRLVPYQGPTNQTHGYAPCTLARRSPSIESDAEDGAAPDGADEEIKVTKAGLPARRHHTAEREDIALPSTTGKRRATAIKTATKRERPSDNSIPVAFSKNRHDIITKPSEDEPMFAKRPEAHPTVAPRTPPPIHIQSSNSSSFYASSSRHHPMLSPGARARLEIFDYMMGTGSDEGGVNIYENAAYDATDNLEPSDVPPKSTPKFPTPPLTTTTTAERKKQPRDSPSFVPETDLSQPQRSDLKSKVYGENADGSPPPEPHSNVTSPRKLQSASPIVVMRASSSSKSPARTGHVASSDATRALPRKSATRPMSLISPKTFRKVVEPFTSALENEPPMSSIESFSSPRKDKGKQHQSLDVDELQGSSDEEVVPSHTDAEPRARGKALYEQALRKKELPHVTDKSAPKKALADVVQSKVPLVTIEQSTSDAYPFASGKRDRQGNLEIVQQLEDAYVDLSGGNSTTIDTFTQSGLQNQEAQPIVIRQEVEESTQEALLGGNPALPAGVEENPAVQPQDMNDGPETQHEEAEQTTQDSRPDDPPVNVTESEVESQEPVIDDVDIYENDDAPASPVLPEQNGSSHPSISVEDLHGASMIVNPSQGQQQEKDDEMITIDLTSLPTRSPPNNTDMTAGRLSYALSALNKKSDEIQALQHELTLEREKSSKLEDKLKTVKQSESTTTEKVSSSSADPAVAKQSDPVMMFARASWEEERRELKENLARLAAERDRLATDLRRVDNVTSGDADRAAFQIEGENNQRGVHPPDQTASSPEIRGASEVEQIQPEPQQSATELWEAEREKWSVERAMMVEAREALTADVSRLKSSLDAMTRSKALAEKDRDFFRDQYMQASGFVSTTRAENLELEQKATIAEGRARDGVALIKSMFESQIKALKEDVDRWKGVAALLQEKDLRTNDSIRQRAAEQPELVERCQQLEDQVNSLYTELELARQTSSLERRAFSHLQERKQKLDLHSIDLTYSEVEPGGIAEVPDPNVAWTLGDLSADFNLREEEAEDDGCGLYPCKWKTGATAIDQCQQAFDCKEDLDRHMYEDHYCHQIKAMACGD